MHFYSQNIGDYRRDTMGLSPLEHGIYRILMDTYYLTEKPLDLNIEDLMRSHSVRNADEMRAFDYVLTKYFIKTESGYRNKRCELEIEAYHAKSNKAAGSAKSRWNKVKQEKEANAMRTHSERIANGMLTQEPINSITKETTKSNTLAIGKPNCPHEDILKLYHEILPIMPAVKIWTEKRQALLKARWSEDEKRQNLEYWERLFKYILKSDFLCMRTGTFQCSLEWILKSTNFVKIIEGNYENR